MTRVLEPDRRNQERGASGSVLDDIYAFLGRFVAYPSDEARVAHTLWCAHCHLMDCWENTPRIAFLSPEPASGKSRALEITELLVPRPVISVNASPAYLFRRVSSDAKGTPTILYDEIDTVFGERARENEELRGLINAGHRRGATAGRCVTEGDNIVPKDFPAYAAMAMAGLGNLPDTILTRSVIVRMRRRKRGEPVEQYRHRRHKPEGDALRDQLAAWCETNQQALTDVDPAMPEGVADRDADVWEPLLAVADAAGDAWPERARAAAVALVSLSKRDGNASLGVRLLTDLRTIFGDDDNLHTQTILEKLCQLEEAPWSNYRGSPITAKYLADKLDGYGVESKNVRVGSTVKKGYTRGGLFDAWERYLPPPLSSVADSGGELPKQYTQAAHPPLPVEVTRVTNGTKPTETGESPHQEGEPKSMRQLPEPDQKPESWAALRQMPMAELERLVEEQGERSRWPHKTWGPGAELDLRRKLGNPSPRTPVEYKTTRRQKGASTIIDTYVPDDDVQTLYGPNP